MCFDCYLITAVVGAFVGLAATRMTGTRRLVVAMVDVGFGLAGAVFMAWFVSPLAGNPASERVTTIQLIGALFGAVLLLALYRAVRPNGW